MQLVRYNSIGDEDFNLLFMYYNNRKNNSIRYNFNKLKTKLLEEDYYFLGISVERDIIGLITYHKKQTKYYVDTFILFDEAQNKDLEILNKFLFDKDNVLFCVDSNDYRTLASLEKVDVKCCSEHTIEHDKLNMKLFIWERTLNEKDFGDFITEYKENIFMK